MEMEELNWLNSEHTGKEEKEEVEEEEKAVTKE